MDKININKSNKRIYAFIDSQNLNLGIDSCGWKLDFKKFRLYLNDKYGVKKAYLFIGHIAGNEHLYARLQEYGYILVFKPTLNHTVNGEVVVKGNVDAELVLYAMMYFNLYDKAIIVSGDGDFHCLIEHLDSKNKLLKILVPSKRYSSLLRKFNNKKYIAVLDGLKNSLRYKHKKTGIRGRSKP